MLFLLFHLDKDRYALDATQVLEVMPLVELKRIPQAPPAIAGTMNYRGVAVPVIDLRALALNQPARRRSSTRIVLVRHVDTQGEVRTMGLVAERATETFTCSESDFQPSGVYNPDARYLGPVTSRPQGLVQRVAVDALLTAPLRALLFERPGEL